MSGSKTQRRTLLLKVIQDRYRQPAVHRPIDQFFQKRDRQAHVDGQQRLYERLFHRIKQGFHGFVIQEEKGYAAAKLR